MCDVCVSDCLYFINVWLFVNVSVYVCFRVIVVIVGRCAGVCVYVCFVFVCDVYANVFVQLFVN